jgi:hypothetical protein
MSEGSLPPFGVFRSKFLPFSLAKRVSGRLKRSLRRSQLEEEVDTSSKVRSQAAAAIREYADSQATLFERAERLRERAERLENEGTPSDSARNRAERAESEVATGLVSLRASFSADSSTREKRLAFDQEVEALYPTIRLSDADPQPS